MKLTNFLSYLQAERRFSPNTLSAYRTDLSQFFQFLKEIYDFDSIDGLQHQHIRAWIVHLMQDGLTTRSVNRKLSCLKSYFKYLLKRKYISRNPMNKLITPKTGKRLPVYIKEDRLHFLFEQLDHSRAYTPFRNRLILELLYATGMRRSELINLEVKDVDKANLQLKVLGKGNKERLLPVSHKLMRLLEEYIDIRSQHFPDATYTNLFLTGKGKKMYPKLVYLLVRQYLDPITTVEKRSPHVLRHSFATHLSNNGADLNAIKELLGHANLAATQVYTHNSIEKLKSVYQQAHPKAKL